MVNGSPKNAKEHFDCFVTRKAFSEEPFLHQKAYLRITSYAWNHTSDGKGPWTPRLPVVTESYLAPQPYALSVIYNLISMIYTSPNS